MTQRLVPRRPHRRAHPPPSSTGGVLPMSHYGEPFRGLPRELRDMIWSALLDYHSLRMRRAKRIRVNLLPSNLTTVATSAYADENQINGKAGLAIDLSILLANKQTYKEAASIFYRLNDFIIPVSSLLRADPREVRVGPWMRRIVLESGHLPLPPSSSFANFFFTFPNLNTISISMPREPEIECNAQLGGVVDIMLLVHLTNSLAKGVLKCLRLVYPVSNCTNLQNGPDQFETIKVIRRMGMGILYEMTRDSYALWREVATSWHVRNQNTYSAIIGRHGFMSHDNFIARFEDVAAANDGSKETVVLLTRTQDEPRKVERVDRPKVKIQLPPRPLKRKRFGCDVGLEHRPTKTVCLLPLSRRARCMHSHPSAATAGFRAAGSPFADTLYQREMNHLSLLFQDLKMKG